MNVARKAKKYNWFARLLSIVYISFISLFALDSFGSEAPLYLKIATFFIHLIPSFVLLATLIILRRRPLYLGLMFILLSIIFTLHFRTYLFMANFLIISIPLVIIGVLFIYAYFLGRRKTSYNEDI